MKKEFKELIVKLIATIVIVICAHLFLVRVHVNHSNSMAPSMRDGDLVIINKMGELTADTVCYSPMGFGRIVGLPGDVIYISEDKFTINGNVVSELIYYKTKPGELTYPYTVPEGSYFILNDMREDLNDSRTFGAVPEKDIEGAVWLEVQRRGF